MVTGTDSLTYKRIPNDRTTEHSSHATQVMS